MANREFSRKPYDKYLYTWKPDDMITKKGVQSRVQPYFCNATPRSQGEDWVTTFVYQIVNENGITKRIAYVACDYAK